MSFDKSTPSTYRSCDSNRNPRTNESVVQISTQAASVQILIVLSRSPAEHPPDSHFFEMRTKTLQYSSDSQLIKRLLAFKSKTCIQSAYNSLKSLLQETTHFTQISSGLQPPEGQRFKELGHQGCLEDIQSTSRKLSERLLTTFRYMSSV